MDTISAWNWTLIGAAATAFIFGMLVGLSEVLTRYRDEPLRATLNLYGLSYLLLNGLISIAAFALMRWYGDQIFPLVKKDLFMTAVVAGFGAMIVMRSKLFTFNTSTGQDFAIGPAIIIDTIYQTIDRKIDRLRASERQKRVYKHLNDVSDFERAAQYLEASLLSFQNLSGDQKRDISAILSEYRKSALDNRLKVMALGFAFLTIAGEENFDQVIANMKAFLALGSSTQPLQIPPTP